MASKRETKHMMALSTVDTDGIGRSSVSEDEETGTFGTPRLEEENDRLIGLDSTRTTAEGGEKRGTLSAAAPPPRQPQWFYGGALAIGMLLVVAVASGGGGDTGQVQQQQQQILGELQQLRGGQAALLMGGQSVAPSGGGTLQPGHDRFCQWGSQFAGETNDPARRLPQVIRPLLYEWSLVPGVDAAAHSFAGSVDMTVTMGAGEAPSSCIPMHADPALQIRSAAVVGIDGSVQCLCDESTVGERPAGCAASTCASIISRPAGTQSDQIVIHLQTAAGERVNDGANTTVRLGYRSDYPSVSAGASGLFLTAPSPSTPPLIVTQFESFGARKAFPCMDEPALEAPFAVSYILPRDPRLVALANMPLARTYEHPGQPEMIVHQFEQTPPMPTYLVCVVIGQLVRLPSHHPGLTSTSVSVWAVAEHASLLADAVEYSAAALRFMELFTGVEFALPKADLVAVPGFGGAMENWGLLVMDESRFLVNRTTESTQARVASANIVCHEVAHQWFGDLVTMDWWTNIWLNEGFATLFSYLCTEYVRHRSGFEAKSAPPVHRAGVWPHTFTDSRSLFSINIQPMNEGIGASSGPHQNALRSQAHSTAALSHSASFGTVAYAKAGATLAMAMDTMERSSPGSFGLGLGAYLRSDAFGNAEPMDLWNNLGRAIGSERFAARMLSWSENGGYPLVTVTVSDDGSEMILRQERYQQPSSADVLWSIPVVIGLEGGGPDQQHVVWLETREKRLQLSTFDVEVGQSMVRLLVKPSGMGLYRVDYGSQWGARVAQVRRMVSASGEEVEVRGVADMIQDAFGLMADRRLALDGGDTVVPLELIRASFSTTAQGQQHNGYVLYATWLRELNALALLTQEESATCNADLHDFQMRLAMGVTGPSGSLGAAERRDDTDADKIIRPLVLGAQAAAGCPVARGLLCPRVRQAIWRPHEVDNELRAQLLMAAVRGDCQESWRVSPQFAVTQLTRLYTEEIDTALRHDILYALAHAKDAALLRSVLDFAKQALPAACPTAPTTERQHVCRADFGGVFGVMARNPYGGARAAWSWLKDEYAQRSQGDNRQIDAGLLRLVSLHLSSADVLADMLLTLGVFESEVTEQAHPGLWRVQQNIAQRQYQGAAVCNWLTRERQRNTQAQGSAGDAAAPKSVIVYNTKVVHTVSDVYLREKTFASAFVIVGDRFAEVCETDSDLIYTPTAQSNPAGCSLAQIRVRYPEARLIDAGGKTVIPGLIDAHGHLRGVGVELLEVNLRGARSIAEAVQRIRASLALHPDLATEGHWVSGRGWDQTLWNGPDTPFPTKADLDSQFPGVPIVLTRVDGHGIWVSSAAIEAAVAFRGGVALPATDPHDGQIIRLPPSPPSSNEPSGVFLDGAMALIRDAVPPMSHEKELFALAMGVAQVNKWGLTSVHDAGVPLEAIQLYRESLDNGNFSLRNYIMVESESCNASKICTEKFEAVRGVYKDKLSVKSVKIHLDGALGSYGAVMIDRYSHLPSGYTGDPRGTLRIEPDIFKSAVIAWAKAGYQVNTHCIGDACNRLCLDAYEDALAAAQSDGSAERHRIEHAQILSQSDLPRFAPLNVIASMQPTHATSDSSWVEDHIGTARARGSYAWRTLLDSGARLAFGSDFTVERVNPFLGIYAAVTRQRVTECNSSYSGVCATDQPPNGWYPSQKLTRYEALRGFTADAAYASYDESQLGRIAVGAYADFLIIDRDVTNPADCSDDEIINTQVLATWLGGELVYSP